MSSQQITNKSKMTITFLGLGIMGGPMSANLANAGFDTNVWNRTPNRPGSIYAQNAGAKLFSTVEDAVKNSTHVFTCVSDVPDLEAVLFGENGAVQYAQAKTLFVDFGTIGPKAAIAINEKLSAKDMRFIDAPVTGGDTGAKNGTLTILCGGNENDFNEVLPALGAMGKKIFYCGDSGAGQATKLCNQILCAVNLIGTCESLALAEEFGIDKAKLVEMLKDGAGGSWSFANLGLKISDCDFNPAFPIKHMQKDLRLVLESASEQELLPGTNLAQKLFEQAKSIANDLDGNEGTQAMFRAYSKD